MHNDRDDGARKMESDSKYDDKGAKVGEVRPRANSDSE